MKATAKANLPFRGASKSIPVSVTVILSRLFGAGIAATYLETVASTLVLHPQADTTLFAFAESNNSGRSPTLVVGGIDKTPTACRALVAYDWIKQYLPADAVITNISLSFSAIQESAGGPALTLRVHRSQGFWQEGNGTGAFGRFTPLVHEASWRSPGQGEWSGGSFDPTTPSASIVVTTNGTYTIPSTAALIADAQAFRGGNLQAAYGWILVGANETDPHSARRITSRDGGSGVNLIIGFSLAPLSITGFRVERDAVEVDFIGIQGGYYSLEGGNVANQPPAPPLPFWWMQAGKGVDVSGKVTIRRPGGLVEPGELFRVERILPQPPPF